MNIIAIDTSNQMLGVAVMQNDKLIGEITTNINKDHSSRLMPALVDLLKKVSVTPEELDKIVVANGPGSYTGTRIGVTTAKTMAWGLDIPIYTVSSLETLAYNGQFFNGYICPFFDARRKTVFTGLYKWKDNELQNVMPECNILMTDWLAQLSELKEDVLFLSPHIDTFEEMITKQFTNNAIIPDHPYHLSKPSNLILISKHKNSTPTHLANPDYLRITEAEANLLKREKDENVNG